MLYRPISVTADPHGAARVEAKQPLWFPTFVYRGYGSNGCIQQLILMEVEDTKAHSVTAECTVDIWVGPFFTSKNREAMSR